MYMAIYFYIYNNGYVTSLWTIFIDLTFCSALCARRNVQQTLAQILKHRPLAPIAMEKIKLMNTVIDFYIYINGTRRNNVKIYHNDD